MRVVDLEGNEYNLKLTRRKINDEFKSEGHKYARGLLKAIYPNDNLFEEIAIIPGLIVDFIIPLRRLIVECQGRQHYEFSEFMHGDHIKFNAQKTRDNKKKKWAELNNFVLIELDDTKKDTWKDKILGAYDE